MKPQKPLAWSLATAGVLACTPMVLADTPITPSKVKAKTAIRLRFVNTDVSDVLQAIALQTRANIVYPAQLKKLISLDVATLSISEALGFATAAAGLVYRQVGATYVVGTPTDLRQLIEPFGEKSLLGLRLMKAEEAVKLLEGALPYLTVRPAGNRVALTGSPEDIQSARELIAQQEQSAPNDPLTTDVSMLKHASAKQLAAMLKTLYVGLHTESVGIDDKAGGALGITGPRSLVEKAKEAIARIDVPALANGRQKSYRVYKVRYANTVALKAFLDKAMPSLIALTGPETYSMPVPQFRPLTGTLANTITSMQGAGGGSGGGSGGGGGGAGGGGGGAEAGAGATGNVDDPSKRANNERSKHLLLMGEENDIETALKMIADLDIPPKQVVIEVKVVDTSPEFAQNIGFQWSWSPLRALEYPGGTAINTQGTDAVQPQTAGRPFGTYSKAPFNVQAVLNAMVTRREARILASPNVRTVENEDASVFIGETLRTQVTQANLSGVTIQVLEFPVGIILLVRPRISEDGKITMRVHPVVSTITGIDSNNLPQTSTREADTTVVVKDGETIVIGGLIREEMTKTIQEIPILSKLPLVGELFRNRNTSRRKSEIMVFITPRIVPEDPAPKK